MILPVNDRVIIHLVYNGKITRQDKIRNKLHLFPNLTTDIIFSARKKTSTTENKYTFIFAHDNGTIDYEYNSDLNEPSKYPFAPEYEH